jgi:hypothetical protein
MAHFQTQILGKFWSVWQWKMLLYFVYFSVFGMFCPEKSGNPDFMPENPFNDTYLGGARVTKIVI